MSAASACRRSELPDHCDKNSRSKVSGGTWAWLVHELLWWWCCSPTTVRWRPSSKLLSRHCSVSRRDSLRRTRRTWRSGTRCSAWYGLGEGVMVRTPILPPIDCNLAREEVGCGQLRINTGNHFHQPQPPSRPLHLTAAQSSVFHSFIHRSTTVQTSHEA